MDFSSLAISSAGLEVERTRVDVAALNLANMHTLQGAGGATYQPLRVIAQASPTRRFETAFANAAHTASLPVATIEAIPTAPRAVHQPTHPLADARGLIYYPNIDHTEQMFTLISATRAYEANLAALQASRTLVLKTLEIGGRP